MDEDCPQAIPTKCRDQDHNQLDMPTNVHPELMVQDLEGLFSKQLGQTNVTKHVIDTEEATPIKVPPRQIPFHYADKVHAQLQDMVMKESSTQAGAHGVLQLSMCPKVPGR